jgi:ribosomal protein L16 Arg81 hydroxylase
MPPPKVYGLDVLLAPTATDAFLRDHWERRPLHVARDDPRFFADLLDLDEIDRVLTTLGLHHPSVELVDATRRITSAEYTYPSGMIDPVRVYQRFAEGATIIMPRLDHVVPALAHLCRAMEARLSARFQTNIYLTPAESQGFAPHFDNHDVFVLQVSGVKAWRLYDTPIELPYRGQHFAPTEAPPGAPSSEVTLRPGDVLYVPRGVMHDAVAGPEPSLHVTLGALFTSWTELLIEALARVGLEDARFRRALPPGFARDDFDRAEARETFRALLRRFADTADLDAALDHFAGDLVSTRHALAEGQLREVMRLPALSAQSALRRRPGLLYRLSVEAEGLRLSFYGNELSLPLRAEAPLRHALESETFVVGALPGPLDDEGKVTLARRLLREGLVRFADAPDDPGAP